MNCELSLLSNLPYYMSDSNHKTAVFKAVRWRFLVNTIWVSLTFGFLIYVLTLGLKIPYGWAVFLLVLRAVFWPCFIDINKLNFTLSDSSISGPYIFYTSHPQTVIVSKILADQKFEWFGSVFSIEDTMGNQIMAHYAWYSSEDRKIIRNLIKGLKNCGPSRTTS